MKKHYKFSSWISVLIGLGVTIGILLVLLLILSGIASSAAISDRVFGACVCGMVSIAWFAGAFVLGVNRRQKGLVWGAVHAGCMFVLVLLVSIMVNGSNMAVFSLKTLLYLLLGAAISGIGGIFGVHFALKRR